jgi:hypothetical protein
MHYPIAEENAQDKKPDNNHHSIWIDLGRRNGHLSRERLTSFIIPETSKEISRLSYKTVIC